MKATTKYRVEEHHPNCDTYMLYGTYNTYQSAERKFRQKQLEGIKGLLIRKVVTVKADEIIQRGDQI